MTTVAKLMAELGLDSSDYKKGIQDAKKEASGLGSALQSAVGTAAGFAAATGAMNILSSGFSKIKSSIIGTNATLQTATLQFETLLGSADAAKDHVKSLFSFAGHTPFETGPVIQASKNLLVFGGTALDTEKTLERVGNAAAIAGQPINDIAFWVGRAYAAIKGGQPFGEAAARLQEMAVLTPEARAEMEKLQKSGASTEKVFGVLEKSFDKFDGAMKRQAGTWEGLTSTLSDSLSIIGATAGKPIFDLASKAVSRINDLLGSDKIAAGAEAVANRISAAFSNLFSGIGKGFSIFQTLIDYFKVFTGIASGGDIGTLLENFNKLPAPIQFLANALVQVVDFFAVIGYDIATLMGFDVSGYTGKWTAWGVVIGTIKDLFMGWISDLEARFLPVWQQAQQYIEPVLSFLSANIGPIGVAFAVAAGGATAFAAAGPLLNQVAGPLMKIGSLLLSINPIFLLIAAGLAALFVVWDNNFGGIRDKTQGLVDLITEKWPEIQATAERVFTAVGQVVGEAIGKAIDVIKTVAGFVIDHWPQIEQTARTVFNNISSTVQEAIAFIKQTFEPLVQELVSRWPEIQAAAGRAFDLIKSFVQGAVDFVKQEWPLIRDIIGSVLEAVAVIIKVVVAAAMIAWSLFGDTILSVTKTAFETLKSVIDGALKIIKGILDVFIGVFTGDWDRAWNGLKGIVEGVWETIKALITYQIKQTGNIIKGIVSVIGDAGSLLLDVGKDIVRGLINGIWSMAKELASSVSSFIEENIPSPIRKLLHIGSPSKLMMDMGKDTILGLIIGINKEQAELASTVVDTIGKAIDAAEKMLNLLPKLADAVIPDTKASFDALAKVMADAIGSVFAGGITFNKIGLEHVQDVSSAASAAFDAFAKIADFFDKIKGLKLDVLHVDILQLVTNLAALTQHTLSELQAFATGWNEFSLGYLKQVAETIGAVFEGFTKIADGLNKLIGLDVDTLSVDMLQMITNLAALTEKTFSSMKDYAGTWDKGILEGISAVATTAQTVFGLFGTIADTLTKLNDLKVDTYSADMLQLITNLAALSGHILEKMNEYTAGWDQLALTAITGTAQAVQAVFSAFSTIADALNKLNELGIDTVSQAVTNTLTALAKLSGNMLQQIDAIAVQWTTFQLSKIGTTIEAIGKVFSALSTVLQAVDLASKTKFSPEAVTKIGQAIDAAFSALDQVFQHLNDSVISMSGNAATVAENIGKVFGALKSVLDVLNEAKTAINPSVVAPAIKGLVDNAFMILNYFIEFMPKLDAQTKNMVAVVAPAITSVMQSINAVLDLFLSLSRIVTTKIKTVTSEVESSFVSFDMAATLRANFPLVEAAIKDVVAVIREIYNMYERAIAGLDTESVAVAASIANNIKSIISTIKDAVSLFMDFGKITDEITGDTSAFLRFADQLQQLEQDKQDRLDEFAQQELDLQRQVFDDNGKADPKALLGFDKINQARDKYLKEYERKKAKLQQELEKAQQEQAKKQQQGSMQEQVQRGIDKFREIYQKILDGLVALTEEFTKKFADKQEAFDNFATTLSKVMATIKATFDMFTQLGDPNSDTFKKILSMLGMLPQIALNLTGAVAVFIGLNVTEDQVKAFDLANGLVEKIMTLMGNLSTLGGNIDLDNLNKAKEGLTKLPDIVQSVLDTITKINEVITNTTDYEKLLSDFDKLIDRLNTSIKNLGTFVTSVSEIANTVESFKQNVKDLIGGYVTAITDLITGVNAVTAQLEALIIALDAAIEAALRALEKMKTLNSLLGQLGIPPVGSGATGGTTSSGGISPNYGYNDAWERIHPSKGGMAAGGTSMGGIYKTGERGYEYVFLPYGAQILSHYNSQRLEKKSAPGMATGTTGITDSMMWIINQLFGGMNSIAGMNGIGVVQPNTKGVLYNQLEQITSRTGKPDNGTYQITDSITEWLNKVGNKVQDKAMINDSYNVNFNGPVYGVPDLRQIIKETIRETIKSGGGYGYLNGQ